MALIYLLFLSLDNKTLFDFSNYSSQQLHNLALYCHYSMLLYIIVVTPMILCLVHSLAKSVIELFDQTSTKSKIGAIIMLTMATPFFLMAVYFIGVTYYLAYLEFFN